MRFRRPYQAERRQPADCSAADLGLHVKLGEQFTAVPPPDYPACDDVTRRVLRELGDNFRPLYVVQHWQAPGTNGLVRICLHVLSSYIPITKDKDPRKSGTLARNVLLPTVGNCGIQWRAPIYNDDVLDGLTDDERMAGALPRYEPLDMGLVDVFRRHLWEKRHQAKPLSKEEQDRANAYKAKADDEAKVKAHVGRLSYLKRHEHLNHVEVDGFGVIPPTEPTVFLNSPQEGAAP